MADHYATDYALQQTLEICFADQQANITMCLHVLKNVLYDIYIVCLDDDRSVASCQQTCCKLIVKACYQVIHRFAASGFNKL